MILKIANIYEGLLRDHTYINFLVQTKTLHNDIEWIVTWNQESNNPETFAEDLNSAKKKLEIDRVCMQVYASMFRSADKCDSYSFRQRILREFNQGNFKWLNQRFASLWLCAANSKDGKDDSVMQYLKADLQEISLITLGYFSA